MHSEPDTDMQDTVCAVVVTYHPDNSLQNLVSLVRPQVNTLVIIDNTPAKEKKQNEHVIDTGKYSAHVIQNKKNIGQAAALNQGIQYASQIGCKWTLTLDQDTECYPDMVETLIQAQKFCGQQTVVIGANYFDPQKKRFSARPMAGAHCIERKTVITSGSLINTHLIQMAGGFRDDFFIDQVDHELCLRMRSLGYRIAICKKPVMSHHVGQTGGAFIPLIGTLPNHPPLRKYYITRNSLIMLLEYWRKEPAWCVRRFIRLILGLILMTTLEDQRLRKFRAFAAGFSDGIAHRTGPCEHPWLTMKS